MNHISDANKMVSDTPRTDEQINGKPCTRFECLVGDSLRDALVTSQFARQLERELNAANESFRKLNIHALDLAARIKRLEEAGEKMVDEPLRKHRRWILNEAKEAKP